MKPLRWLDERILWLRDQLTPGQRWTAALALTLVILIFGFGLPDRVVVRSSPAAAAPRASAPSPAAAAGGAVAPPSASSPLLSLATAPAPSTDAASAGVAPAGAGADLIDTSVPAPLAVVALVRPGGDSLPGRGDADAARVFLAQAPFHATVVTLSGDDAKDCAAAKAAGSVALAGEGLPDGLRTCLAEAGIAVVAFDQVGDEPPGVSTRRGVAANLVDLAGWNGRTRSVAGPVGLVADDSLRAIVDPLLPRLPAAGLPVVATAYVAPGPAGASAIADGVRSFAAKGVRTVVFAAPVDTQARWVAQEAVLAPGTAHVVADAFDSVTNGSYPPTFDGARALTSVRVPWFAADHGETPAQAVCRKAWEAAVTPPTLLAGEETVRVFAWCEHVALVSATASAAGLRAVHVSSPLTSDLGPLSDGTWGPTQDAVVQWHASCGCWQELRRFEARP